VFTPVLKRSPTTTSGSAPAVQWGQRRRREALAFWTEERPHSSMTPHASSRKKTTKPRFALAGSRLSLPTAGRVVRAARHGRRDEEHARGEAFFESFVSARRGDVASVARDAPTRASILKRPRREGLSPPLGGNEKRWRR
jgi:hypothetical protein